MVEDIINSLRRVSIGEGSEKDKEVVNLLSDKEFSDFLSIMTEGVTEDSKESYYSLVDSFDCMEDEGDLPTRVRSREVPINSEDRDISRKFAKNKYKLREVILSKR